MTLDQLIDKYNVPTPRYTSYPTVPNWKNNLDPDSWKNISSKSFREFNDSTGISIYIHLPYCESLCTYCGCNKRITKQHSVEMPYIETVLKEWKLYTETFEKKPVLKQLHLGGGTPTFFSPENLEKLISEIKSDCIIPANFEYSFEGHPSNTSFQHLYSLSKQGFDRVSYGIQDFDLVVQKAINRYQSIEEVQETVDNALFVGYTSINFDLVYGLPFQDIACLTNTIKEVIKLKPDRIAFYSYAHVPWTAKGQRLYSEDDLPSPEEKLNLYYLGRQLLTFAGYKNIGMDHFALETDELFTATEEKRLQRNFMGYTTNNTQLLIGLGVSSISDAHYGYAQNHKTIEEYKRAVNAGELPISKSHLLTDNEIESRERINDLMCQYKTDWNENEEQKLCSQAKEKLNELERDGLVYFTEKELLVSEQGKSFVRNICTVFDQGLWEGVQKKQLFSKAV